MNDKREQAAFGLLSRSGLGGLLMAGNIYYGRTEGKMPEGGGCVRRTV